MQGFARRVPLSDFGVQDSDFLAWWLVGCATRSPVSCNLLGYTTPEAWGSQRGRCWSCKTSRAPPEKLATPETMNGFSAAVKPRRIRVL